jgi:adenylosuccinate lyase
MKNHLSISPIDGRYHDQTQFLHKYFSEYALVKNRVRVEVEYLIKLVDKILPNRLTNVDRNYLRLIYKNFSEEDFQRIKRIENEIKHDVKAVEIFLRERVFEDLKCYVHFGLTSQDVNSISYSLALREWYSESGFTEIYNLKEQIESLSERWWNIPMVSRTHGQLASPTRLGKEMKVFSYRLERKEEIIFTFAKFGGAVGNANAHYAAFPNVDWEEFFEQFVNSFNLERSEWTTQIDSYDSYAERFNRLSEICTILLDFSRDIWQYISLDYLKLRVEEHEVGSSTMPHKVNPINFENAEGNLGIAIALFRHFSEKLPVSRLQRDLSDSTVLRNIGVPIAHMQIAINQLSEGLEKLEANEEKIRLDLYSDWSIITEGIQTILRIHGFDDAYDRLKTFSRGKSPLSLYDVHKFIDSLEIPEHINKELKLITPENYIGRN